MNNKSAYAVILKVLRATFGDCNAKVFDARFRFHRKLDLRNPKTLADKVSWLSVFERTPLMSVCTDKYAVREYVASNGLEELLIPVLGGPWNTVEDVDFDCLPSSFVLKATHGCKMNCIVPDKSELDIATCRKRMQGWLDTTYGTYSMELHYEEIPHRIYAEQLLAGYDNLVDYKFHCFNGEPQFVLVCSNRQADGEKRMRVTLDLFDMDWQPLFEVQPAGGEIPGDGRIPKPALFAKMCRVARVLSRDFKFVRVDLYESDGVVLFGELTFTPACCVFPYFKEKFNIEMGKKLDI